MLDGFFLAHRKINPATLKQAEDTVSLAGLTLSSLWTNVKGDEGQGDYQTCSAITSKLK